MNKPFFLLLLCSYLFLGACSKTDNHSNERMVELLEERHTTVIPTDITYYYNQRRAQALDSIRNTFAKTAEDYISHTYWYIRETLNSGATEKSIQLLDEWNENQLNLKIQLSEQWDYFFKRLKALCYIRLGEQVNCLVNHTASSCILPIQGDGIHIDISGSSQAIAIIEPLLEDYPEDLELVWLLNVCYQTIGQYPEGVPEEFLISPHAFAGKSDFPRFEDVAPQLGVAVDGIAGGSIVEDFNNDGLLDLVVTSSGIKKSDQTRFFLNSGDGTFSDHTEEAGLMGYVGGLNAVQTDYNNDGFADIFIMRGGWFGKWGQHPNSLLKNNQDGTFTDVTAEAGLLSFHPTQTAVWADFNNDGWLDVFIGNESTEMPSRLRTARGKFHYPEFYVNQRNGTFKNVARIKGFDFTGLIKGVTALDFDNDGLMDLYVSIMGNKNLLFRNKGNLEFEEVGEKAGVQAPLVSFSTAAFDYNNDGNTDLYVGAYTTSNNPLAHEIAYEALGNTPNAAIPKVYKNNGNGTFSDVTEKVGMNRSIFGMGVNYGDLDNDGYLDLYVGTGDPNFESIIPNRMFRNVSGAYFEEVSYAGGFSNIQKGHGVSWGDIDNDGDEDIYITMGGAHEGDNYRNQLLINPTKDRNWIGLKLVGQQTNAMAIGAKIHIETSEGEHFYRRVSSGASFGANSFRQHIGLGSANRIKRLEITWPVSEKKQVFEDLPPNQFLQIVEGQESFKVQPLSKIKWTEGMKMSH